MGSKGGSAQAPPASAQPATSSMDPTMMQMLMTMMQSNQQQMPQMPTVPDAPQIIEAGVPAREAINWQDTLQDMRDKSAAQYDDTTQKEAQLVEAFYPGAGEPDSLLTEEIND